MLMHPAQQVPARTTEALPLGHALRRLLSPALALALALTYAVGDNRFLAFVLAMTFINLLWATGMNLMYGYVGLMPLMFAGVAGISAWRPVHLSTMAV